MRRPLAVAAVGLILFGIEVATGAISVAAVRMWAGLVASLTGNEFVISRPRYVIGVLLTLVGGVIFGVMAWAEQAQGEIRIQGSACPNCGARTKRVRRRKRHRILSRILETGVTRRSCERCGWNGLSA